MATTRSYGDACGVARALDAVGERWSLLVVRELLLAPRRFSDLRRSLPAVSSNMLTDRLRELEGRDVLRRRPPTAPSGPVAYELTSLGRDLEPVLVALGAWGQRFPRPTGACPATSTSVLLLLRGALRGVSDAPQATFVFELDDRTWTVRIRDGDVDVLDGAAATYDVHLRTAAATLDTLVQDPATLGTVLERGEAAVNGDVTALRRLLANVSLSAAPGLPAAR